MHQSAQSLLVGAALGVGLLGVEEALHLAFGEPPIPAHLLPSHLATYAALGAIGGLAVALLRALAARLPRPAPNSVPVTLGVAAAFATVLLADHHPALGILPPVALALVTLRGVPTGLQPHAVAAALAMVALPAVNLHAFASPARPAALAADVAVIAAAIAVGALLRRAPALWLAPWAVVLLASRPPALPDPRPADGRPPIVLVLVDTLRADHLGVYGHPGGLTPNLDRFAERAVVYEQAQSAAPWTVPAVGSLFTGLMPSEHGAGIVRDGSSVSFAGLRPDVPTLAGDLGRFGYVTGGLVANPWLRTFSGLGRDFDHWDDRATGHQPLVARALDRRIAMDAPPYLTADVQTDRAIAWMRHQGDAPWLLVVHYMDPHSPYAPPPAYRDGDTPEALYQGEIRFLDAEIGRLLDHVPDTAWVALVADHGEAFGDHEDPPGLPEGTRHGHTLFQELLRVPLIVRPPAPSQGRLVQRPVRAHDLMPTLLVAAGVPVRAGLDAEPLAEALQRPVGTDRPARSEQILFGAEQKAVRLGSWKLVRGPGGATLYDLDRDPREQRDRAHDHASIAEELAPLLPSGELRPGTGPDGRTRAMLEALGYVLDGG